MVALLLICIAVAGVGVPRLRVFGHDIFISLDGGWRVLNGQRPGVDFYAQMGPVYYLLHATGLWLAGNDARGLGYGSTLATTLIACWAFLLLSPRMKPGPLIVACLFLTLLAAAPVPLGFGFRQTAFAMKHNRYGYALTGLVMLECFLPQATTRRKDAWLGGLSTGVACVILVFLKISFGMVATLFAAMSLWTNEGRRIRFTGIATGFGLVGFALLAYLRFDIAALAREYGILAGVQAGTLYGSHVLWRLYVDGFEIAVVVLLAALVGLLPEIPGNRRLLLMLVVVVATVAGELLLLTNTQPSGLPLLGVAALLVLSEVTTRVTDRPAPHIAPVVAMGLAVIGIPMCQDAIGLASALTDKIVHHEPGYRLKATHMASIEFLDCPSIPWPACRPDDNGQIFVRRTEAGIALAQANSLAGESIRSLAVSNPFSFVMQRPPSHGGAVNLGSTNISVAHVPPKELLLGDVGLILLPKFPDGVTKATAAILHSYPELLGTEYSRIAESPDWILFRRIPSSGVSYKNPIAQ